MQLTVEARCRSRTGLLLALPWQQHGAVLGAAVHPGGQMQCAEHQVLGRVPTGTAAATVFALSASMPVAGPRLPAWQLISCN